MRDHVEGDLLGELLGRGVAQAVDGLGLVPQLVHAFLAGARDRVVGLQGGQRPASVEGHVHRDAGHAVRHDSTEASP